MQKLNFKWIKDLNLKDEILKSLEQTIGKYDFERRGGNLEIKYTHITIKENIDKYEYIEVKNISYQNIS